MKHYRFGQDNWSACGGGGHCRRGVVTKSFHSDADFYTEAASRQKSNRSEQRRWWAAAAAADHTMQQRRSRAMIRLLNFSPGDQGWTWMDGIDFEVYCFQLFLSHRDPLGPRGSPGPESDILSNLLGGATSPVENPVRCLSVKQEYN